LPAEFLGRTGRCNKCGVRIRLAAPVAELLDPPAPAPTVPEAAPAEEPVPMAEAVAEPEPLPAQPAQVVIQPVPRPVLQAVVRDDPAPQPARRSANERRDKRSNERQERTKRASGGTVLLTVLAVIGLLGGVTGGILAVRHITAPDERESDGQAATTPTPQPRPGPKPELKQEPKQEPKQTPEPNVPVKPQLTADGVKFPAPVKAVTVGAGGANLVFQLTTGELVFYDAKAGKLLGTLTGIEPDSLLAASRDKLFVGRRRDGQIESYDLRGGKATPLVRGVGKAVELVHLAVGSASDGPLVAITRTATQTQIRLLDVDNFAELRFPVEHPAVELGTTFPVTTNEPPHQLTASADGRTFLLTTQWFARTDDRYAGGSLGGTSWLAPAPDGRSFVGSGLYGADGKRLTVPAIPTGTRRYFPAPGGPFVLSAEYTWATPRRVKLLLHIGPNPQPLGELPGGDALAEWAATDTNWTLKLAQRVVFVPDPGVVIFTAPGSDRARVFPVDMPAMLERAGRDIVFTSIPPAFPRKDQPYVYQLSAVSRRGPVTFKLTAGPPNLVLNQDGLVRWPAPGGVNSYYDVKVVGTAAGRQESHEFRLVLPKNDQVAIAPPKKNPPKIHPPEPNPFDPKKDPPKVDPLSKTRRRQGA
jgi:hypothetical protein